MREKKVLVSSFDSYFAPSWFNSNKVVDCLLQPPTLSISLTPSAIYVSGLFCPNMVHHQPYPTNFQQKGIHRLGHVALCPLSAFYLSYGRFAKLLYLDHYAVDGHLIWVYSLWFVFVLVGVFSMYVWGPFNQ